MAPLFSNPYDLSFSKQWLKNSFECYSNIAFLVGKNTIEAKQWLDKRYGDSAPGKSTIIDWNAEFKRVVQTPMTLNALVA